MADTGLDVVLLAERLDALAQIVRRQGLAKGTDIVAFAFHGQQRGALDRPGIDDAAAIFEDAARQMIFLEHLLHRLQIEFGRQVGDREILVIEFAVGVGLVVFALHDMPEQVEMGAHVTRQVHRHEGGELDEAGIDMPPGAGIAGRHGSDQVGLEPVQRLGIGQLVDLGGIDTGVHRARHQGHGSGNGLVLVHRHGRHRHQQRGTGLANRDGVGTGADLFQEADQVIDILVGAEAARLQRHIAAALPVGDVDIMVRQHGLGGLAQQGGEMPCHRRHDQHLGLAHRHGLAEMDQVAEGQAERHFFFHLLVTAIRPGQADGIRRPLVNHLGAGDDFRRRRHVPEQVIGPRAHPGLAESRAEQRCTGPDGGKQVLLSLVCVVQHRLLLDRPQRPEHSIARRFYAAAQNNACQRTRKPEML